MTLIDLGSLDGEPVTLAEAKAWCRIERADEDALVMQLVRAARETVERDTRLVLGRRGFRLALDPVPADRWIEIPRHPLVAVTGLVAFDAGGAPRAFPVSAAVVERALGVEAVRLAPEVAQAGANGVEIEFTAGYAPGAVPEGLRLAVKQIVAACFELRGVLPAAMQPGLVPASARALLAAHRPVRL